MSLLSILSLYDTSPYDTTAITAAGTGIILVSLIGGLIGLVIGVIIWWRIFSKAGYNGAMALWLFVPIANLIVILILAFGEWPIHRELNQLRQRAGGSGAYPPQFPPSQPPQYQQPPQFPQGQQYQQPPQYPQGPQYPQR